MSSSEPAQDSGTGFRPSGSDPSPPPAYTRDNPSTQPGVPTNVDLTPEALAALTSAFSSLMVPNTPTSLSPDTCLVHLKLLYAFHQLKEDVGYTEGLWGIHETGLSRLELLANEDRLGGHRSSTLTPDERVARALARLREKRWALYVARAVDRYEAWWNSFNGDHLIEAEMEIGTSSKYSGFLHRNLPIAFDSSMLPPLGEPFDQH